MVPNAQAAQVARSKLADYLLNPSHPDGGPKARFWLARGFAASDLPTFEGALTDHLLTRQIISQYSTPHGTKFCLVCEIVTPDGRNPCVNTIWIVDAGDVAPRFVTAYPA